MPQSKCECLFLFIFGKGWILLWIVASSTYLTVLWTIRCTVTLAHEDRQLRWPKMTVHLVISLSTLIVKYKVIACLVVYILHTILNTVKAQNTLT
jgi:hypothetical protein